MTRLNYTGRKRIMRENLKFRVELDGAVFVHLDSIDLSTFELPANAKVVVEPYRSARVQSQRIDVGEVGDLRLPQTLELATFEAPDDVLFRVKVIGVGGAEEGKLLAAADQVRPISEDSSSGKRSILPVRSADLGQRLWRLNFDEGSPVLEVSRDLSDWNQFARRPIFQGLVYPEALGQVARWLIDNRDDLESDSPPGLWDRYFREVLGVSPLEGLPEKPSEDDVNERADEVARTFSQRYRLRSRVDNSDEDGGDL
jgi:hypothetical protein